LRLFLIKGSIINMSEHKFLYQKIYSNMLENILNGVWSDGSLIPKEQELLDLYKVSRDTLRKALERLKRDGFIYSKSGIGTFIKSNRVLYKLSFMESFSEISEREGKIARSIVYNAKKINIDNNIADKLKLEYDKKAFYIERLRLSGNKVLCYEKVYINAELCPHIDKYVKINTSLYDLYENKYNLKIKYGDYSLEAMNADKQLSEILGINENDAVLFMNATIFLEESIPLYTILAYYIGSEYIFTTTLPRN